MPAKCDFLVTWTGKGTHRIEQGNKRWHIGVTSEIIFFQNYLTFLCIKTYRVFYNLTVQETPILFSLTEAEPLQAPQCVCGKLSVPSWCFAPSGRTTMSGSSGRESIKRSLRSTPVTMTTVQASRSFVIRILGSTFGDGSLAESCCDWDPALLGVQVLPSQASASHRGAPEEKGAGLHLLGNPHPFIPLQSIEYSSCFFGFSFTC